MPGFQCNFKNRIDQKGGGTAVLYRDGKGREVEIDKEWILGEHYVQLQDRFQVHEVFGYC